MSTVWRLSRNRRLRLNRGARAKTAARHKASPVNAAELSRTRIGVNGREIKYERTEGSLCARPITIPAKVTITGNDLRAQGEFSINRTDFQIKATSAAHGLVSVRNEINFPFDIVGHAD